jgi:Protein of unknown function (DUF2809)
MTARFVYFITAAVIFIVEVAIAVGIIGGAFIRGSVGDILVIVLLYCLVRAALGLAPVVAAVSAVAAGFLVEAIQYIKVAELLGLKAGSILYVAVGNTFALSDLFMYVLGGLLALFVDQYILIPRLKLMDRASRIR